MSAALRIISVCKSVMSFQEPCVFLCTSRSILSAADASTAGGWEEGSAACACVCVEAACGGSWTCVGSHGTRRTVGWF